jgi:transmembrane sensor
MKPQHDISLIIAKKISGEATGAELEILQHWLSSDPANQQELDVLTKMMHEVDAAVNTTTIDTEAAWLKIDPGATRIRQMPAHKNEKMMLWRRMAIAAAVITVIAGTWLIARQQDAAWNRVNAADHNLVILLPDGSKVWARKGSRISYRKTFTANREVRLAGEAFFDVAHRANSDFRVLAGHAKIRVLGTAFLVHSGEEGDEVIVSRGSVGVQPEGNDTENTILEKGQKIVIRDRKVMRSVVADLNYLSWKTGMLDFKEAPLEKVLWEVSDYYGVPVLAGSKEIGEKVTVTVHFDHETLDQVTREISLITGLTLSKKGDTWYLNKK